MKRRAEAGVSENEKRARTWVEDWWATGFVEDVSGELAALLDEAECRGREAERARVVAWLEGPAVGELERLEREATPGPWCPIEACMPDTEGEWFVRFTDDADTTILFEKDAHFIAAFRNAAPHLIAIAKAAKAGATDWDHSDRCNSLDGRECSCGLSDLRDALARLEGET